MKILGMISGTSHDGIDVAVVDFGLDGGGLTGSVVHSNMTAYDPVLRERLRAALPPAQSTFSEMCELDTLIGQAFADAAVAAIDAAGPVDAICTHGQTVYHWVRGDHALGTLQIGQPAWIAEATGAPVISDVRIRDIVAGGHGAPLVPILDALMLGALQGTSGALNLGGISNITVLAEGAEPFAYDIGPANALIDAVVAERSLNPIGYDDGGRIAASGVIDQALLKVLLAEEYYELPTPKSTGKELFHDAYVQDAIERAGTTPSDSDLVATLTELTVRTVASDVRSHAIGHLVISGGGSHNRVIVDGLRRELPGVDIVFSDEFGAPADTKEAIAFALIGWHTMHGLPGAVPSATGARAGRILGTITPGAEPLQLPAPTAAAPTSLTLSVRGA